MSEEVLKPISAELNQAASSTAPQKPRHVPVTSSLTIAHEACLNPEQLLLCKAAVCVGACRKYVEESRSS